MQNVPPELKHALKVLADKIKTAFPDLPNARWIALRLLDGDESIADALRKGDLGNLRRTTIQKTLNPPSDDIQPDEKTKIS